MAAAFAVPPCASAAFAWHGSGQRAAVKPGPVSYLGIDVRDVGDDQVTTLKLKDTRGAEVIRVDHDGPAGKMGLREHDVVLQMNGVAIEGEERLRKLMHDCPPGRMVVLTIARDGQVMTVSAAMADRNEIERQVWEQHVGAAAAGLPGPQAPAFALPSPEEPPAPEAPSGPAPNTRYSKSFLGTLLTSPTYTGAMLEIMGPQLSQFFGVAGGSGLLVRSVADNSPASMAGLRAGDVVLKANARPMVSVNQWMKLIREAKGKPVTVVVLRDRQEKILLLTPDLKHKS
jgi:S1-C subfamily serine protease